MGGPGFLLIMSEKLGQGKEWVSQVPSFTRFVLAASLPLSILSILGFSIGWWFANIPYFTLQSAQRNVQSSVETDNSGFRAVETIRCELYAASFCTLLLRIYS